MTFMFYETTGWLHLIALFLKAIFVEKIVDNTLERCLVECLYDPDMYRSLCGVYEVLVGIQYNNGRVPRYFDAATK